MTVIDAILAVGVFGAWIAVAVVLGLIVAAAMHAVSPDRDEWQ